MNMTRNKTISSAYRTTRVFVTGATGFIGSHLCRELIRAGAKISILSRTNADRHRVREMLGDVTLIEGDIRDHATLRSALRDTAPQIIFHLATAISNERRLDLIDPALETNVHGTLNLMRAAAEMKRKPAAFINTGSCEEYGNAPVPFNETDRESPVSPYSASKVAATYFGEMFHRIFDLPVITLRPFLTYGPGQDANRFVPALITAALAGRDFRMSRGTQWRELNYIDDIVDGFLRAPLYPKAAGEIINIGCGAEYQIAAVARRIKQMVAGPGKLLLGAIPCRPGEPMHFHSSNAKARRLLGWKPTTPLEDGLSRTIEWYRENR